MAVEALNSTYGIIIVLLLCHIACSRATVTYPSASPSPWRQDRVTFPFSSVIKSPKDMNQQRIQSNVSFAYRVERCDRQVAAQELEGIKKSVCVNNQSCMDLYVNIGVECHSVPDQANPQNTKTELLITFKMNLGKKFKEDGIITQIEKEAKTIETLLRIKYQKQNGTLESNIGNLKGTLGTTTANSTTQRYTCPPGYIVKDAVCVTIRGQRYVAGHLALGAERVTNTQHLSVRPAVFLGMGGASLLCLCGSCCVCFKTMRRRKRNALQKMQQIETQDEPRDAESGSMSLLHHNMSTQRLIPARVTSKRSTSQTKRCDSPFKLTNQMSKTRVTPPSRQYTPPTSHQAPVRVSPNDQHQYSNHAMYQSQGCIPQRQYSAGLKNLVRNVVSKQSCDESNQSSHTSLVSTPGGKTMNQSTNAPRDVISRILFPSNIELSRSGQDQKLTSRDSVRYDDGTVEQYLPYNSNDGFHNVNETPLDSQDPVPADNNSEYFHDGLAEMRCDSQDPGPADNNSGYSHDGLAEMRCDSQDPGPAESNSMYFVDGSAEMRYDSQYPSPAYNNSRYFNAGLPETRPDSQDPSPIDNNSKYSQVGLPKFLDPTYVFPEIAQQPAQESDTALPNQLLYHTEPY